MSTFERDPNKRRVKPVGPAEQCLLDFDLGESSDDSDFRIEDCKDSDDDSLDSDEDAKASDKSSNQSGDSDNASDISEIDNKFNNISNIESIEKKNLTIGNILQIANQKKFDAKQLLSLKDKSKIIICSGCLGDRSDDANEIVECDGCGVTVHEGCYGVSDSASVSSTVSSCSTEPWFCEACRAGITNPSCELCPNSGGIFKETDVGKWVHLVCALYVSGVAFGEVDKLSSVTLFEMPYNKWGAKACSLCEEQRFARTGVCIGCDAGMCKTFFHVTCAQREGYLSEANSEEVDQADPYYAHCKMHSDKALVKRRKRNWLVLKFATELRIAERNSSEGTLSPDQIRNQRKLAKYRNKYLVNKSSRKPPWVPTQKMPRLLTTSASACRRLLHKAEVMGIDTQALEIQEAHIASLVDIRKKWHIPAAFSVEFMGYYLDRNNRLITMKEKLEELLSVYDKLQEEQQSLRLSYDKLLGKNTEENHKNVTLRQAVHKYHSAILNICPNKPLESIDEICKPPQVLQPSTSVPLQVPRGAETHQLLLECGICKRTVDQHLLAKCDTCHLHYHLGCLNPPLTRMPKKTKLMGWQCSECDKESSGSEVECLDPEAPRKLRHAKDGFGLLDQIPSSSPEIMIIPPEVLMPVKEESEPAIPSPIQRTTPKVTIKPLVPDPSEIPSVSTISDPPIFIGRPGKKRRREKHHRYSPDSTPVKEHKRKRKRKNQDMENPKDAPRIKIKIKPILPPNGEDPHSGPPQMFVASSTTETIIPMNQPVVQPQHQVLLLSEPARESSYSESNYIFQTNNDIEIINMNLNRRSSSNTKKPKVDQMTKCDVCEGPGSNQNLVRCDECLKCYHFTCLDPPVKKSPKRRGYSWHCADCDPTEIESDH